MYINTYTYIRLKVHVSEETGCLSAYVEIFSLFQKICSFCALVVFSVCVFVLRVVIDLIKFYYSKNKIQVFLDIFIKNKCHLLENYFHICL